MSRELKRILLKKKMMEIKAGDYLEWYDSLDTVEKGLYKEEFKKLQEKYEEPAFKQVDFDDLEEKPGRVQTGQFTEDLIKSRLIEAAESIAEAIEEELYTMVQEEMIGRCITPIDAINGEILFNEELDDRFDKIYKYTLAILISKQLKP